MDLIYDGLITGITYGVGLGCIIILLGLGYEGCLRLIKLIK